MRSIYLEELSWPDVKAAMQSGVDTVVFAVGSTEQHGPHLPLACDTLIGESLARMVAQRLDRALVAPTVRVGCSQHHMAFPGTISINSPELQTMLLDYMETLFQHGFQRVAMIPSHGGNFATVAEAARAARQKWPDKLVVAFTDLNALLDAAFKTSAKFGITAGASGIHAGEFETSILLSTHPELVNMSRAEEGYTGDFMKIIPELMQHGVMRVSTNGILGDARPADASRGKHYLSAWVDLIMAEIERPQVVA
jgi:creatinine amidohydrolase/Fe(II)-dependent formamide hydrolase-like protein